MSDIQKANDTGCRVRQAESVLSRQHISRPILYHICANIHTQRRSHANIHTRSVQAHIHADVVLMRHFRQAQETIAWEKIKSFVRQTDASGN